MIDPVKKIKVKVNKPESGSVLQKAKTDYTEDNIQGIVIDNKTNMATAKTKPRTFVENKQGKYTKVLDNNNKVVWEGRNDNSNGVRKLDSIKKDVERTMEQREANARVYNGGTSKK